MAGLGSPCSGPLTAHHLRYRIKPDGGRERIEKDDYRTILICAAHHLYDFGPHAIHRLTAPGEWERFFGVDIEAAVGKYNELWISPK